MYECNDKMVSHPDHYQSETGLEVIDVIEAFTFDLTGIEAVDTGNALKYLCRWKKKNGLQDLKKAMWYLQNLIDHVEKLEMENQYVKNDIQISKDLAAGLKRKEVMEGVDPIGYAIKAVSDKLDAECKKSEEPKGRPVKVLSRWQCNHCKAIVEVEEQNDILAICGFHMEREHPLHPYIFALDFDMLEPGFVDKNEKEND